MRWLIPLILLTACAASPNPALLGARHAEVSRDGRSYTVWWTGTQAEVIRHGYAKNGEHQAIRATMIGLIPEVTRCNVSGTLEGDSGEMRGPIRCPKAP